MKKKIRPQTEEQDMPKLCQIGVGHFMLFDLGGGRKGRLVKVDEQRIHLTSVI